MWKDSRGYTCKDYQDKKWCTWDRNTFGVNFARWDTPISATHSYDAYATDYNGVLTGADDACCACGATDRVTQYLTTYDAACHHAYALLAPRRQRPPRFTWIVCPTCCMG